MGENLIVTCTLQKVSQDTDDVSIERDPEAKRITLEEHKRMRASQLEQDTVHKCWSSG